MAPFKFHFSKMSKSRSKESRSSTECEEPPSSNQHSMSSRPETPAIENAGTALANTSNEHRVSPPPSYERVLQETRMENIANAAEEERQTEEVNTIPSARNQVPIEIIHKSSKELYRAMAKQCGITCKMSDQCRCVDCQSHYFDCEFERDEQQGTDGGLGAGTPMFIAEVMHGTACVLL